jgi:hypothetical protein
MGAADLVGDIFPAPPLLALDVENLLDGLLTPCRLRAILMSIAKAGPNEPRGSNPRPALRFSETFPFGLPECAL